MLSRNLLARALILLCLAVNNPAGESQAAPGRNQSDHTVSVPVTPAAPPLETHWNLIEVDGTPVVAASAENQPYIYLQAQGDKLSGSGGCNRLFGSFDLSGSSLQFHSVASTRMACASSSMEQEPALLDALKLTTAFQVAGSILILQVDGRVLARFQAQGRK